jgi:hypothetical protein
MDIPIHRFHDGITIMNIGDVHRGDASCNVDLFLKAIDLVLKTPDMYWVSTGDLLNVALKTGVSDVYTSMSPEKEFQNIKKELAPITGKCLGIVSSNHHRRLKIATGFDLDRRISTELDIPYLGTIGMINVICGTASYYVAMHHGVGSGKKRGSKVNSTEQFSELIPGADVYLEGHTHTQDAFINETHYIDRKRQALQSFYSYFVTTGHFLHYDGSYAQDFKLPSRPQGSSLVSLKGVKGSCRINAKDVKTDFFY